MLSNASLMQNVFHLNMEAASVYYYKSYPVKMKHCAEKKEDPESKNV